MQETEIDRLERIGDFYAQSDRMDELLIEREATLLKRLCINTSNVLEVGCGNGYSTQHMVPIFDDYEVLEPSTKNLMLMKSRPGLQNITSHNVLLEDFSCSRRFDNILFLNVIEHIEDPIDALIRLQNLLTDEGRIYISAPNCMSLNRRAGYHMGLLKEYSTLAPKDYAVGHRRLYTVDMMHEHCELAGLKVIQMKGVYLKPLAESQMIPLGEDTIKAFHALGEDIPEYCANLFAIVGKKYYSR